MVLMTRRNIRRLRYFLLAAVGVLLLDLILSRQSVYPPLDYNGSASHPLEIKSVYIAANQWNSATLLEQHWIPNLIQLLNDLKLANISVYVSIYENGSWDSTKVVMQQLKQTLTDMAVEHRITIDDTSHEQIISESHSTSGWIQTAYGKSLRRIPYLANVRNEALKPLSTLTSSGVKFDRILYINDVVFSAADVMTLLRTRNGQYAAACALDFLNPPGNWVDARTRGLNPPGIYDDFAVRDSSGNALGSHLYPYFVSSSSKAALMSGHNVPVQSCWNGLVAFDAAPFQTPEHPLRFRGIPDSLAQYHVEASECCTIHYDNSFSESLGVWINPAVRVGYSEDAYNAISASQADGSSPNWPSTSELRWGYWKSKWLWRIKDPFTPLKISSRIRNWQHRFPHEKEPGLACVSDLAMILMPNGWKHLDENFS